MKRRISYILIISILFSSLSISPAVKAAGTRKEIYSEIGGHLLKRHKTFSIKCDYTKAVSSLIDRMNGKSESRYYQAIYDITHTAIDNTTDGGDYLYGIIRQAGCYYAGGRLRFYGVKYFETKKQTKKVNQFTRRVVRRIKKRTGNQYKRIQLAYAFVINQITYDTRKNCLFSAYSGYVKRKSVCNGYALMLYKILTAMGFSARFVSGEVRGGKSWYLHAWNKVKYRGKWYNLDACSDDPDDGKVYADFFMKSNKAFSKTHRQDYFIP